MWVKLLSYFSEGETEAESLTDIKLEDQDPNSGNLTQDLHS